METNSSGGQTQVSDMRAFDCGILYLQSVVLCMSACECAFIYGYIYIYILITFSILIYKYIYIHLKSWESLSFCNIPCNSVLIASSFTDANSLQFVSEILCISMVAGVLLHTHICYSTSIVLCKGQQTITANVFVLTYRLSLSFFLNLNLLNHHKILHGFFKTSR